MIYFTSDLHLGHQTVLKNRPQFRDTDEMKTTIIANINSIVKPSDTLYILGDLAFRIPVDEANELICQINGKKILIRGNHDKDYDESLFEFIKDYDTLKFNKKKYILMHYPITCWAQMKYGSIQLHGHLHSAPEYNNRNHEIGRLQYDVGVDAHDFRPVPIDEIAAWADTAPWMEYREREHHRFRFDE